VGRRDGAFSRRLDEAQPDPAARRWIFVPYDQLSARIGPLSREDPAELGIILIENPWKAARRPYHKQKLALVLANLRHFALEQAARGVAVRHVVARGPYSQALKPVVGKLATSGPVRMMAPAERELRVDLQPLVDAGLLQSMPHEGWLTTKDQFERSQRGASWRMDAFYRLVRSESGILMHDGKPVGGKFSFDTENRKPWRGEPPVPDQPRFSTDPVKAEVGELVETHFAHHPGKLDLDSLPATRAHATQLWRWAKRHCLPLFGPFEDAMSTRSTNLFHTRISGLMNLHRLLPGKIVNDVVALDIPRPSKEGFVRQVLGWREFMHHVHVATDGFRRLPEGTPPAAATPGDGGYSEWRGEKWGVPAAGKARIDGGAAPSFLGADAPVPPAFWGKPSGLACLDRVVREVWSESYGHHITRLMILSNLATLLDVSPRGLTDWFWVAYSDAYDWVVEPNVLGMGTYALGDLMTTKPYVSGAAYINRMSDYCSECDFDPKKNCPITSLYWAFLDRHRKRLEKSPRLRMPYNSLAKRSAARRRSDRNVFLDVRNRLQQGEHLKPRERGTSPSKAKGGRHAS
jgi:deoxyribodipyrimidine photolyase-related protein